MHREQPLVFEISVGHGDHHIIEFLTDYLRLMVSGSMNAFEIENLMDNEIETHHHEGEVPVHVVAKLGDGLPEFGIVAAVMGVCTRWKSVGCPAELGILIAHALVGTFLRYFAGLWFCRSAFRSARAKIARIIQDVPVRQGHAAGQHQRLRARDCS